MKSIFYKSKCNNLEFLRSGNFQFFQWFFLPVQLTVSVRANYKNIHRSWFDDAKIFASLCEINKNYFGYDGCLGRQLCKFCVDFLIRLLISKPMPRAYTWFMVFVTDQNHIEGFQKKKKKGFKYYQLQATWYGFHCLLEIKSQQDLSYHKSADKKFVYRFIKFLLWVSTFLITISFGCRVLLNKYCFEKVRAPFSKNNPRYKNDMGWYGGF